MPLEVRLASGGPLTGGITSHLYDALPETIEAFRRLPPLPSKVTEEYISRYSALHGALHAFWKKARHISIRKPTDPVELNDNKDFYKQCDDCIDLYRRCFSMERTELQLLQEVEALRQAVAAKSKVAPTTETRAVANSLQRSLAMSYGLKHLA